MHALTQQRRKFWLIVHTLLEAVFYHTVVVSI